MKKVLTCKLRIIMTKLIIKHKGQNLQEVWLEVDKEYSIGRGKDNDIVLPEQPGVSRKHLQILRGEDEQWFVKNLSSTGSLMIDGNQTEEGTVPLGGSFQTQDFEFILLEEKKPSANSAKNKEPKSPASQELAPLEQAPPALYNKQESQLLAESGNPTEDPKEVESDLSLSTDDKTKMLDLNSRSVRMSACLKVSDETDSVRDIFKLEEDQSEWICGREEIADIVVENPNISRQHFKITKEGMDYFIEDLKSSNGTILNDKELRPGKAYAIQSGDMIYILDIEIAFEIKNLALEKELAQIKVPLPVPQPAKEGMLPMAPPLKGGNAPQGAWPVGYAPLPANAPGVIVEMPEESASPLSFVKKNKKRVIMYGAVVLVVLGFLVLNNEESEPEDSENQMGVEEGGELADLTEEEKSLVKNTYMAARMLYSQAKFDLCRSEIKKLHKYTKTYEDSKKLEIACTQAIENQKKQMDIEYKRKKAKDTDQRIQQVADRCREKFSTFHFRHELVACLQPAIELSPADPRVLALTDQFDTNKTLKEEQKRQKEERQKFIRSIFSKYHHAKSLHTKGKTLKAMSAYQHFINISRHKELTKQRAKAKRELASIKQAFQDKNSQLESACKSHFQAKAFQKAYYACDKAVDEIPPPHDKKARELRQEAQNKLELVMKPLYEEANLNESVGNVAIAQEYWKKIIQLDVRTGIYYKRAKDKLSKY